MRGWWRVIKEKSGCRCQMIWHLRPVSAGFWKLQQIKFHLWLKSEGNPHSDQSQGFGKIDGRRIKIEGRVWICHLLTRTMKNLTLETQGMTRLKTDWPRHLTYFSFLRDSTLFFGRTLLEWKQGRKVGECKQKESLDNLYLMELSHESGCVDKC